MVCTNLYVLHSTDTDHSTECMHGQVSVRCQSNYCTEDITYKDFG